jgi:MYXO-CTERM domain-containing protein
LSLVAPFAFAAAARADVACGDQTCPKNYECKSAPAACPDIACAPDDANCTPPECNGTVETCVALPCASDADCADGMACYTSTEQTCPTAPACAKDQDCAQPADTACTSTTVTACVPKYLLPCESDADCGAGFTCEEEQDCACSPSIGGSGSAGSGSAGSGSAGSGSASSGGTPVPPAPPEDGGAGDAPSDSKSPADAAGAATPESGTPLPPDCTCHSAGTKACNLKLVPCSADSDCAAGFTCEANPSGVCSADSNGTSSCSADPAKICLPPYARLVSNVHAPKDATDSSGDSGLGSPTASPSTPESSGASASNGAGAAEGDGGCSIAPSPRHLGTPFGFAALALAGLAGARRRRAR